MRPLIACLAATQLVVAPLQVANARQGPFIDDRPNMSQVNPDTIQEFIWVEGTSKVPPYPKKEDLAEFQVNREESKFRYYLDAKSLSIGEGDEVVRYTAVIVSAGGAWNVAYEGMRCDTKEYKTYAFGVGDRFQAVRDPKWEEIKEANYTRYRADLWDYHFCQLGMARPVADILRSLNDRGNVKGGPPSVF